MVPEGLRAHGGWKAQHGSRTRTGSKAKVETLKAHLLCIPLPAPAGSLPSPPQTVPPTGTKCSDTWACARCFSFTPPRGVNKGTRFSKTDSQVTQGRCTDVSFRFHLLLNSSFFEMPVFLSEQLGYLKKLPKAAEVSQSLKSRLTPKKTDLYPFSLQQS